MTTPPTAEETLNRSVPQKYFWLEMNHITNNCPNEYILSAMREYAAAHVEACKKEIAEKVNETLKDFSGLEFNRDSILNSYPKENIK